jgi:glycosyltransferase involved in cell wall biosynthesis
LKHSILLVNSIKFVGGGETSMLRLAAELQRSGHKVCFGMRKDSRLAEHARGSTVETVPLWLSGDLNPFLLLQLHQTFRRRKIDFVIANNQRDIRVPAIVSAATRGPKVIGLHQVDKPIKNKWNYRLTYNSMASAVVVNSEATKETLRTANPWLDQRKVHVVLHGLDPAMCAGTSREKSRAALGIPRDCFVAGFVGRLSEQKGIPYLLEAIKILSAKLPAALFAIVGTGELEPKVLDFLKEHSLAGKVRVLGFRKDVAEIMPAFDTLLVPSLWEGFGLVLVEAMLAGVPPIASNTSSIPEIVQDGANGLLVPARDPQSLADAVLRLQRETGLLESLAANGRKTVREKYSMAAMAAGFESIFAQIGRRH